MINIKHPKDTSRLRRIALAAQGLLQSKPFGRGLTGAYKAISHLGYVQIDTIAVVERAHNHVLFSRVPDFQPEMINSLLQCGNIFEYWSHAAAFLPISDFRFSLPYKHAIKSGQTHWFKNTDRKLMAEILARIRSDGPLRSRDIETHSKKRTGWWDWKPAKKALEQLYMEGDLMVCDRTGFQKTYDLTERVLPSNTHTEMPSMEEYAAYLIEQQFRSNGFATTKGMTYLRRDHALRESVKNLLNEWLSAGRLEQIKLDNSEVFFIPAGAFEQKIPRVKKCIKILSPFDNAVIQRERLKKLFSYDYQMECYLPETKRKFGYFCLPLLYCDTFVGRMDCKAHRKNRELEIKTLYIEENRFDANFLTSAFVSAIEDFKVFQQCDTVSMKKIVPKNMEMPLRSALEPVNTH